MKSINFTESGLLKTGYGKVSKIIINSHTNGTLKLIDGTESGVAASGTLTSTGAMAPASHATSEVVSSGVNVTDGSVLTIGATVYTFKTELTGAAYEVLIGDAAADTLDNLKAAVNAGTGEGTTYGTGTVAHPSVIATTNTDTVQTFVARTPGVAANSLDTTTDDVTLTWADATLGGGTGNSNPGVTTEAATFTIGSRTYMFVIELSETSGASAIADQILYGGSVAAALDNMKLAINASGAAGTNYSTGTVVNADVVATTNSNTEQTVVSRLLGSAGNSIATTETLANTAWGAATLASGAGLTGEVIVDTITFSAVATTGERVIDLGDIDFDRGLYAVIGGTANLTIVGK